MRLKPQTYAITINTHARHRLFQRTANAELIIATLFRYRDQARFLLHGFVIMPDHIHVLLTPSESTAKAAQPIKGGFSFALRDSPTQSPQTVVLSSPHHDPPRPATRTRIPSSS